MKNLALLLLLCIPPCAVSDGLPDLGDVSQAAELAAYSVVATLVQNLDEAITHE